MEHLLVGEKRWIAAQVQPPVVLAIFVLQALPGCLLLLLHPH
jgi:hypothetical protein